MEALETHGSMVNSNGEVEGEGWRNWAEMPRDVLSVLFEKLGAFEVLFPAQWVCRAWNRCSHEPGLWRRVDMRFRSHMCNAAPMKTIAREAVDRSNGLLEEFYGDYWGDDELMRHIADRTNRLRCLCLISCFNISNNGLIEIASRSPLLEEIEITLCSFNENVLEHVGQSCPKLKCLKFNGRWYHDRMSGYGTAGDKEAFAVAKTMHELRHLQLVGNQITIAGLSTILDNCPHLESLDIRHCFNLDVDDGTHERLSKIKRVRFPHDFMHDYDFVAKADRYDDDDDDDDDLFDQYDSGGDFDPDDYDSGSDFDPFPY